jgi:cell division protease FtsH
MLPNADRVTKVSIIPRGLGALGYTLQLPIEDRYLLTRSELRDRMAGLMGGRVAEEEVFGEPSTGASNDLQHATGLARMMVRDYGMSAALGPVSLGDEHGPGFLGVKGLEPRAYSDHTALEVDREVQAMVLEAQERARTIVRAHRDKLDSLAARLLTAEVVEEEEIVRLWGPKVVRPGTIDGRGHAEAPPENPNHPAAAREGRASWVLPQAKAEPIPGDHE